MKKIILLNILILSFSAHLSAQEYYTNSDVKKFMKPHLRVKPIKKYIHVGEKLVIRGTFSNEIKAIKIYQETKLGLVKSVKVKHNENAFTAHVVFNSRGKYILEIGCIHKKWSWKMGILAYIHVDSNRPVTTPPFKERTPIRNTVQAERVFLRKLNRLRARYNLNPMKWDKKLEYIARYHARLCAKHGFSAHTTPWSGSVSDRAKMIGYHGVGENIAGGRTPARALNGLFKSIAHRSALLNPFFTKVGIGVSRFKSYYLFTVNFLNEASHFRKLKQYKRALNVMKYIERSIKRSIYRNHKSTLASFYRQRGWINMKLKRYGKANYDFINAYQNAPDNMHVIKGLAHSYYRVKKYPTAIKYYNKALEMEPKYVNGIKMTAWSYYRMKKYAKSIEIFKRALKIKPDDKSAKNGIKISLSRLAHAEYKRKNYHAAINIYKKALARDPEYLNPLKMIGWSYYRLKKYIIAHLYFKKVLLKNPHDKNALQGVRVSLSRLAYTDFKNKEFSKALKTYLIILRAYPDYVNALKMTGWTYYKLGEYRKARAYFSKAIRLKPDDNNSKHGLEACNRRLNY